MRKLVLWMSRLVVVISLLGFPARARAQNVVTPTLLPAPPGKLTTVNNGPGNDLDPHVSGSLISYTIDDLTIHYFDLSTGLDAGIPQGSGTMDYLSDVSGSTVVFVRALAPTSSVFSFDTATAGAQPVEVSPIANPFRTNPQIGGNTIAWEDFGRRSRRSFPRAPWMDSLRPESPYPYKVESFREQYHAARKLTDNLAVVSLLLTQKATNSGRDRSGDFYLVDIWKKTGDNWQIIARYSTPTGKNR